MPERRIMNSQFGWVSCNVEVQFFLCPNVPLESVPIKIRSMVVSIFDPAQIIDLHNIPQTHDCIPVLFMTKGGKCKNNW